MSENETYRFSLPDGRVAEMSAVVKVENHGNNM